MEAPVSRLRFGTEMVWERLLATGDSGEHRGVLVQDYTLRTGVVSAILEGRCKDDEGCAPVRPWFDFGGGAGLGYALTGDFHLLGHGWLGGWADVRLSPGKSYAVLRVELQRDGYTSEVRGDTQLVVGVGWVEWDISLK